MLGLHNQVWVTSVLCDEDVPKALVLCSSLRRTFSTRRIAVLTTGRISPNLREVLSHEFDFTFYLNEDRNAFGLQMEDFMKLYSIAALRGFESCVYASPTMMAIKNSDKIFDLKYDGLCLLENYTDTTIFLFKPSINLFKALINGLEESNKGMDLGLILKNWANKQQRREIIPEKFNRTVTNGIPLLGYEDEISMINFLDYPNKSGVSNIQETGILGKLVAAHWLQIYENDVLPLIDPSYSVPKPLKSEMIQKYVPSYASEPIAIVGMSCRHPGSNNLEEFWDLLVQGLDATSNHPPFRWLREHCSIHRQDARKTNAGFLKVPVDEFDAKFFGISPKEALCMDPQHRLLHELVWEGLEDACVDPNTLRGTSGSVFMGSWTNDYKDIMIKSGNTDFYREYMGNSIGAAAARISFLLGLTGPSIATESGCSSAIVAVDLACRALRQGQTNLALACGVNLLLNQFDKDLMPMIISPDGHSKTFSDDANGFARAEGGGVLVLKRLSDALSGGDHIWGLIRGSAVSQEGISKSMGTPTVHCESLAMTMALDDANVTPEEVSYVEAHGTGTIVGDPLEVAAIAKAYNSPARKEPLIIGSVKTNVGHTESCSGITGIVKVILAMHHQMIPAHRNFSSLNPSINLNAVPAVIPLQSMEWKKINGKPRLAGVSSFGITGTDTHVILEEPPQTQVSKVLAVDTTMERPLHLIKLSAKTEEAMDSLLAKYMESLKVTDAPTADISFSANTGRSDFQMRTALIGKSNQEISEQILKRGYLRGEAEPEKVGKICFLFTGQGSQYPGMAKQLYEKSPVFRMYFDHCDKILREIYNIKITDCIWPDKPGSANEQISRTIYSQTSIFCVEYALLKLWESWGLKPDYVLGHSLGEFSAAVCADILTVEDAIKLVAERSKLIDELPSGKMLVIKADKQQVLQMMNEFAGGDDQKLMDVAAVNSPEQTVVAGDSNLILEFSKFCEQTGIKSIVLGATHAFHSKHMDPMLEEYGEVAKTIEASGLQKCEYISGMNGDVMETGSVDAEYWVQHTRDKVRFLSASQKAVELGCKIFIEIGPQPVLSALTMMNNENAKINCLPSLKKNEDEWTTLLTTLGKLYVNGVDIDWQGFDQFYNRKKVRLPHYPFIGKKFWPDLTQMAGGSSIHPLIGSTIPNASSIKLYQCGLNLKSHEYINDHKIGQKAIFPGAGYLEMCLAAGLATAESCTDSLSKPNRPMKVENLTIKAPLALEEGKTCEIQTVAEFNTVADESRLDWNDLNIKIFHRLEVDMSEKWVPHATAKYSPITTSEERVISFDKDGFHATISKPWNTNLITQMYEKLSSVGLIFGPKFRSMEKLWNREDDSFLVKVKPLLETDSHNPSYIIHPVILDAMIQAIMIPKLSKKLRKTLCVPIKIGKFVWLASSSESTAEFYIQVSTGEVPTAYLLDSSGTLLGYMSGVEFIDTTVRTMEAVLEQQTSSMPDMWEEIWRPLIGPQQYRLDMALCTKEKFYDDAFFNNIVEKYDKVNPERKYLFENLEKLTYYSIVRCFYDCGFEPVLDTVYKETDLREELKIGAEFAKYFHYLLCVLEEEIILEKVGPETWKIVRIPLSKEEIENEVNSPIFTVDLVNSFNPTRLSIKLGQNLHRIFRGEMSALTILFPEGGANQDTSSAAEYYTDYGNVFGVSTMGVEVSEASLKHYKKHFTESRTIFRVCEIGAGTGSCAKNLLEMYTRNGVEFEYTYTDISAAFFPAAEKKFEKYLKFMIFKKFNIEEDPISQGFMPAYYDMVVASDVIHATRNVTETFRNIATILRPGGRFDMNDMTRVNRLITFIFGPLDGFWRFEDLDVRPNHCTLSANGWIRALEASGFEVIEAFPSLNQHHSFICSRRKVQNAQEYLPMLSMSTDEKIKTWLVFNQEDCSTSQYVLEKIKQLANRHVIEVKHGLDYHQEKNNNLCEFKIRRDQEDDYFQMIRTIDNSKSRLFLEGVVYCWSLATDCHSQEDILKPLFNLVKALLKFNGGTGLKLAVLSRGIVPLENNDLTQFQNGTISGFLKSLQNEHLDIHCKCVDIGDNEEESNRLQIFQELWNNNGKETHIAYQGYTRYIPKIIPLKPALSDLKLPSGTDSFQLILPESKSITDLQFGPLEQLVLKSGEIEVQVKSSALNFKDVLNVLKPSEEFKDANAVGFDFAGVVKRIQTDVTKWRVGDRVFGLNVNGTALPSHVKLNECDVIPIPDDMTFSEASTLPAVVATSYHCLIDVARITSADTVLIHTASGGVGLSAIEICKDVGAKIIATAGSKRKQAYLRSLGIQHIFHSRNTNYGHQILEVTNGRGVDVVLNSLTSEGFKEATLKACAPGARFVEMSKLSVWKPDEVKKLRPDVEYTIVDISSMKRDDWRHLLENVKRLTEQKIVNPIPYVTFNSVHIREALQYLQKAKHIGKIVCRMPELKTVDGKVEVYTPMFHTNATYLITGGLGGIGFEVCKWMVKMGAKHVILAGRRPPSQAINQAIDRLNAENLSKVTAVQLDVSNFEDCRKLINVQIKEMGYPSLRGIMHAAGTLHDGLLENQTWETLSSTLKTKVNGTLNLHELTKTNSKLEHFVLFSSMAANFGSPAQSNHAAGNQFEDTFAHYRNSVGLPASSVNWGQWGEVGIATEVELPGVKPMSTLQGLNGLEYCLKSQRTQTSVLNIESFVMLSKLFPHLSSLLDDRVWKRAVDASSSGQVIFRNNDFWQQYHLRDNLKGKQDFLKDRLRSILRSILKADESDHLDDLADFQEMGVDSLMFVEIRNSLQALVGDGVTLNSNILRDCNTIQALSKMLVKVLEGVQVEDTAGPSMEEVAQLIIEDCKLPATIAARSTQQRIQIRDISTVLITGVTGTLGPYLLRELSKNAQIKHIVCLIRPKKKTTAEERLQNILKDRDLLQEIDISKVSCVNGNIGTARLGMDDNIWKDLCDKVDAVFHCAALVQHVELYRKQESEHSMRSVNIGGLKNVLEFSCSGEKLKHVYNASSLLAALNVDEDGNLSESWPEPGDYSGVTAMAYPISKFVGDVIMKEAITRRGIPGKVFRFPLISGDSQTGRFVLDQNHVMLRYIFNLQVGIMASNPFPLPAFPVDICAKLSLDIFFNPDAPNEIYNIVNYKPDTDQEFVAVAKRLGYNVSVVEFSKFAEKVEKQGAGPLEMFKEFYTNEEYMMSLVNRSPVMKQWLLEGSSREDFFRSKNLLKVAPHFYESLHGRMPSMEFIYRDLLFAKEHGWLKRYGL